MKIIIYLVLLMALPPFAGAAIVNVEILGTLTRILPDDAVSNDANVPNLEGAQFRVAWHYDTETQPFFTRQPPMFGSYRAGFRVGVASFSIDSLVIGVAQTTMFTVNVPPDDCLNFGCTNSTSFIEYSFETATNNFTFLGDTLIPSGLSITGTRLDDQSVLTSMALPVLNKIIFRPPSTPILNPDGTPRTAPDGTILLRNSNPISSFSFGLFEGDIFSNETYGGAYRLTDTDTSIRFSAVPIPAASWLFITSLFGISIAKRQ